MQGVTVAIVLFVFICALFPRLVANRPQFYAGMGMGLVLIVLDAVGQIFHATPSPHAFRTFAYAFGALLQVAAVLLLFLSVGGITARGLSREMLGAFEVIRRGETEKEVIIPLEGQRRRDVKE